MEKPSITGSALSGRSGFSLMELMLVVAIITLLLQLAIPSIEMSTEAARQSQCKNNLRQLTLAFQLHHNAIGHYPSSGWGWQWVGHPDRGFGIEQPGGWAYNILPFIGQGAIRELGSGLAEGSREQQLAILKANGTPISVFNCPSRRLPRAFPMVSTFGNDVLGFSPLLPDECLKGNGEFCQVCRSDYAANAGNLNPGTEPGPNSLDAAGSWKWEYSGRNGKLQNGVSHQRSQVKMSQVTDGLSKTYCVGEKYIPTAFYKTGTYQLDALSLYVGHTGDMNRYTADPNSAVRKLTSDDASPDNQHFGAAHPTVFHMSFCDGSVRAISYEVDPQVHRLLGGRNDGSPRDVPGS